MKDQTPNPERLGWRQRRSSWAICFLLTLVAAWTVLRLVLFLEFRPTPAPRIEVLRTFLAGLQRDLFIALLLTIPLLLWSWAAPDRWFGARWHRTLFSGALLLFWMVQVFLLFAEYYFFEEFRSRFNTVAVDYLLYPHEVFINIWDTYPVPLVIGACALVAGVWVVLVNLLFREMWSIRVSRQVRLAWLLGALALFAALSPGISIQSIHVSQERVLNEIANNGALSFASAFWTRNLEYTEFYPTIPREQAYARVRKLLSEPRVHSESDADWIAREVEGDPSKPRLNVVLFLEESLGSEFWGSLGRKEKTLTPEMDRLAESEGMLFTNLYASGNRTVRGFEGVLSSFPPLPGDSIVKRSLSDNVETVARVLKRDGYSTLFVYGGRGLFDGMRAFAVNNGYDRFIEQKHFAHPTHTTIWGVCDEDAFARAIEECRAMAQTGRPFFTTVLSVSNHKPYTYPKGRIPENPDERNRANAVKYSDYALGQFFKAARQESFWTNTIFVVVADHGARVYGSQKIPIHSYEIPLLIVGPAVVQQPVRVPNLGCSLDVSPTLLGLIGRPYQTLFFGRDLLKGNPANERVLINHNRDIGLFAQDRLVVFGLRKSVEYYRGDPKREELLSLTTPSPLEETLRTDGIALFQVADDLYMHRRYRLDGRSAVLPSGSNTNASARTPSPPDSVALHRTSGLGR